MPDPTHERRHVCRHYWHGLTWSVPTEKLETPLARIKSITFRRRLKVARRCLYLRVSSSADLMSADSLMRKNCLPWITGQAQRGQELLRNTEGIRGVEALPVSVETYGV